MGAAVGLWLALRPGEDQRAGAPEEPVSAVSVDAGGREPVLPLPPPPPSPPASAAPAPTPAPAPEGPRVVGPHPDDPHEPGMLPHPMDEAHRRIDAENQLIQRLNDAMSFHKVKEMRAMLVEYRQLDPTDADANQAGYAVIADCIETPGEASLAAAHQFYATQGHSPLRRYVRRICFEHSN